MIKAIKNLFKPQRKLNPVYFKYEIYKPGVYSFEHSFDKDGRPFVAVYRDGGLEMINYLDLPEKR